VPLFPVTAELQGSVGTVSDCSNGSAVWEQYLIGIRKAANLVLCKDGKFITIEIETGKSDTVANLSKCVREIQGGKNRGQPSTSMRVVGSHCSILKDHAYWHGRLRVSCKVLGIWISMLSLVCFQRSGLA